MTEASYHMLLQKTLDITVCSKTLSQNTPFLHAAGGGGGGAGRGDVGTQPQAHRSWGDAEHLVGGVPPGLSAPMDFALQIPPKRDWWWEEAMASEPDRASQGSSPSSAPETKHLWVRWEVSLSPLARLLWLHWEGSLDPPRTSKNDPPMPQVGAPD